MAYSDAASVYLEAGWHCVLPLPERRKQHPPLGYTGYRGAIPSRADIQAWCDGPEGRGNLALRLPPDVIGIDIDAYDGKRGAETLEDAVCQWGGLPPTWRSTNRERGGGSILFFRVPAGLAWPGELGPGIELIQEVHRYAVVWPSVHPEGRPYRWIGPDGEPCMPPRPDELPPLPLEWVYGITGGVKRGEQPHAGLNGEEVGEWITKHGAGQPCPKIQTATGEFARRVKAGGSRHEAARHTVMLLVGLATKGHHGVAAALETVQREFDAAIAGDPTRQADRHEFRRLCDGAVQRAAVEPVADHDPCISPGTNTQRVKVLAAMLMAHRFPDLVHVVEDLIPEGLTLNVGAPKIGKSFLLLDVALAKCGAFPALGALPVQPGPVLYFALEDGERRLQSRIKLLTGGEVAGDVLNRLQFIIRIDPGDVFSEIAEFFAAHAREHPLVVLDTLGKVMPPSMPGETTYQRDYRIASELKRLTDNCPGSALVANHHDRKAGADDFVDMVSGTHGLAGSADSTMVIKRDRMSGEALLSVTGRDIREGTYACTFDAGVWRLDGDDLDEAEQRARTLRMDRSSSTRSGDIASYVDKHPEGVAPAVVAQALDMKPGDASRYMQRLADRGRIRRLKRGVYVPLSVTEDEDDTEEDSPEEETLKTQKTETPSEALSYGQSQDTNGQPPLYVSQSFESSVSQVSSASPVTICSYPSCRNKAIAIFPRFGARCIEHNPVRTGEEK